MAKFIYRIRGKRKVNTVALPVFLFLIFLSSRAIGQSSIEKHFDEAQKKAYKQFLLNPDVDGNNLNVGPKERHIIVPFFSVKISTTNAGAHIPAITASNLIADTSAHFTVYRDEKNNIFFISPGNSFTGKSSYLGLIDSPYTAEMSIVKYCQQFSNRIFRINLLRREKYYFNPFAYIVNHRIKIVNAELEIFDGLEDYVVKTYGSIAKYQELRKIDEERSREFARMKTFNDAKIILQNDYYHYSHLFPKDTAGIIGMFLNHLDAAATLTPMQKSMLYKRIYADIQIQHEGEISDVTLLGKDVLPRVKTIITIEQLCRYMRRAPVIIWLYSRALDKFSNARAEKGLPAEQDDEFLRTEVYGKGAQ